MKVKSKYRQKETLVTDYCSETHTNSKCEVVFSNYHFNGNCKYYTITIEPHELLKTACACIEAINRIARVNYKITEG